VKDLLVKEKLRAAHARQAKEEAQHQRMEDGLARPQDVSESEDDGGKNKKRKRKKKANASIEATGDGHDIDEMIPPSDASSPPPDNGSKYRYDESLLAIIGVLEALKLESNVSAWIRSGQLWALDNPSPGLASSSPEGDKSNMGGDEPVRSGSDSSVQNGRLEKKQRGRDDTDVSGASTDEEITWFLHEPTMDHWSRKGKEALRVMEIAITSGIES